MTSLQCGLVTRQQVLVLTVNKLCYGLEKRQLNFAMSNVKPSWT